MIKIPYEVIEHRENVALKKEYSWSKTVTYWLYLKTSITLTGIVLAVGLYGTSISYARSIFFDRFEIGEALMWIPVMILASVIEYGYTILRVHKRMNVVYKHKERGYFRVEVK